MAFIDCWVGSGGTGIASVAMTVSLNGSAAEVEETGIAAREICDVRIAAAMRCSVKLSDEARQIIGAPRTARQIRGRFNFFNGPFANANTPSIRRLKDFESAKVSPGTATR